jgi:hypothetical protein
MFKKLLLAGCVALMGFSTNAQYVLTGTNPTYTQDFNTLDTIQTPPGSGNLPQGWVIIETGTSANANGLYRGGTGSSNAGDTYSFGSIGSTERALGSLRSGTLTPIYGVSFGNNTGGSITSMDVQFRGEQWRRGNTIANHPDSTLFQYSTNASALNDTLATWTTVNSLMINSPVMTTTAGALDGNANFVNYSSNITLNLAQGGVLWIRYLDFNVVGTDDGLAVDDLNIAFTTTGGGTVDTLVKFSNISNTVVETSGSVTLPVSVTPVSVSTAFTANVVLKSGNATDVGNFSTQPINFAAGAANSSINIPVTDNLIVDGTRTLVFALRNPTNGRILGSDSLFTLTITDNEVNTNVPFYRINQVRGNNTSGQPDSMNVTCRLGGVVYGVNIRTTGGFSFTINDHTAGIQVFSPDSTFGYTVNEGDSIVVQGDIITFRGLGEIGFLSSVQLISSGNPLQNPMVVNSLNEATEGSLVRINNVTLVTPSQWTNSVNGFNVDITDGANTYKMRIERNTTAIPMPAPTGLFSVIGIGSQFASTTTAPFTDGYQIVPRRVEDIIPTNSVENLNDDLSMNLFPSPNNGKFAIQINGTISGKAQIQVLDITGRTISSQNVVLNNGANTYNMDLNIPSGTYIVKISNGSTLKTSRFIVK